MSYSVRSASHGISGSLPQWSGGFCTYTIHDVHVQPVGIVLVQHGRAFFPEVSKVGSQDGWRNDRLRRHSDLQQKATLALRVGIGASVDGEEARGALYCVDSDSLELYCWA